MPNALTLALEDALSDWWGQTDNKDTHPNIIMVSLPEDALGLSGLTGLAGECAEQIKSLDSENPHFVVEASTSKGPTESVAVFAVAFYEENLDRYVETQRLSSGANEVVLWDSIRGSQSGTLLWDESRDEKVAYLSFDGDTYRVFDGSVLGTFRKGVGDKDKHIIRVEGSRFSTVSSRHASFHYDPDTDTWLYRDEGSLNGALITQDGVTKRVNKCTTEKEFGLFHDQAIIDIPGGPVFTFDPTVSPSLQGIERGNLGYLQRALLYLQSTLLPFVRIAFEQHQNESNPEMGFDWWKDGVCKGVTEARREKLDIDGERANARCRDMRFLDVSDLLHIVSDHELFRDIFSKYLGQGYDGSEYDQISRELIKARNAAMGHPTEESVDVFDDVRTLRDLEYIVGLCTEADKVAKTHYSHGAVRVYKEFEWERG